VTKDKAKRHLAHLMLAELMRGLSVEDLIDSMAMAVASKLAMAKHERSARYRRELDIFYRATIKRLGTARDGIEKDGHMARRRA
jgi:hypothetical protein